MSVSRGSSITRDDKDLNLQINTVYFEQICLALRDGLQNQLNADNSWFNFYTNYKIRGCLADIEMFLACPDGADFSCYEEQDIALVHKVFSRTAKYLPNFLSADDAININAFVNTLADDGVLHSCAVQAKISNLSAHAEKLSSPPALKRRLTNLNNALAANDQAVKTKSVTASTQLIDQALADKEVALDIQKPTVDVWQSTAKKIANIIGAAEFDKAPPLPLSFFGRVTKLWFTYQPERQSVNLYTSLKNAVLEAKGPAALARAVAAFKVSWYKQGQPSEAITARLQQLDDYVALVKHNHIYVACQQSEEEPSAPESPRSSETRKTSLRSRASNESLNASQSKEEVGYTSFADHKDFKRLSETPRGKLSGHNNQGLWKYLPGSQAADKQASTSYRSISRGH
jgi:hypothetical protein